jgi:hypothetical protein
MSAADPFTGFRSQANEAIVIGADHLRGRQDGAVAFQKWLMTSGIVDARNISLLGDAFPNDLLVDATGHNITLELPSIAAVQLAFDRCLRGFQGFDFEGRSPRGQLWVYVTGLGLRRQNGGITLRLPGGGASHLDVTAMVDHVKESGVFEHVIFVADLVRDTETPTAIAGSPTPVVSKALPAAIRYCYLSSLADRSEDASDFTQAVVEGLAGAARRPPGVGSITPAFLQSYLLGHLSSKRGMDRVLHFDASDFNAPLIRGAPDGTGATQTGESKDPLTVGDQFAFDRQARDEELQLHSSHYASAIAKLFSSAGEGEFCFALYGPWGRGKTTLMDRVAKLLAAKPTNYQHIPFSAWKYPTAPEVWIHLYEEFASTALRGPGYKTLPILVRTGIAKGGVTPLIFAYFVFALGLFPVFNLFIYTWTFLNGLYPFIGVMGLIWLYSFWSSIRHTKDRLSKTYLSATRHTEKLGLQATIGADLVALLKGWLPRRLVPRLAVALYAGITAFALFGTWLRLTDGKALQQWLNVTLEKTFVIQAPTYAVVGVILVLAIILLLIPWYLFFYNRPPQKILLVVDDLDRCSPQHLVSIMESIKLLVESKEISCRVQVSMLIEEDILKQSILIKYKELIQSESDHGRRYTLSPEMVIRESCEKLFLAHLRLPPLANEEIPELVEFFSRRSPASEGRESSSPYDDPSYAPTVPRATAPGPGPAIREDLASNIGSTEEVPPQRPETNPSVGKKIESSLQDEPKVSTAAPDIDKGKIFSKDEIRAISRSLGDAAGKRRNLGPRGVRAFLFRYQLARMLLSNLGVSWSPQSLANELADRFFSENPSAQAETPLNSVDFAPLQRVVNQVA